MLVKQEHVHVLLEESNNKISDVCTVRQHLNTTEPLMSVTPVVSYNDVKHLYDKENLLNYLKA